MRQKWIKIINACTCRHEYQQWACLELYLFCPVEQGGCGGDMKVLCTHLLNGIMDQALRSVCVDLLCPLDESFSCSYVLPLTCVWGVCICGGRWFPSCLFLDLTFLWRHLWCLLCVCYWSRGMTNMSIRKFSARTMQFNIASLLFSILNFHTGFLLQSFTGNFQLLWITS